MNRQSLTTRLQFLSIGEDDIRFLHMLRDAIGAANSGFVDSFYDRLLQFDETRILIRDDAQLARLKQTQHQYVLKLLAGHHDDAYGEQRSRIGLIHQKVGLEPYLFVQGSALLLNSLIQAARNHFSDDFDTLTAVASSLVKVVMLDVGLAMDAYADADNLAIRESLQKLQENETLLSEAHALAQLGRWDVTLSTDRLRACKRACELLGLPASGACPGALATLRANVHTDGNEELDVAMARAISHGDTYEIRYAVTYKGGGKRFIRERACGVVDEAGNVSRLVGTVQDITAEISQVARIRELALYDHLTGLPNRAHFYQELQEEIALRSLTDSAFSLLFIDLDRFKEINDTEGHGIGDQVLVEVSSRFKRTVRRDEVMARLGGDEFVVIARSADKHAAQCMGKRLQLALQSPISLEGNLFRVSASIGISTFPMDGETAEVLVRNADTAMYEAKRRQIGMEVYTPDMSQRISRRVSMAKRLEIAIESDAIDVYFQPQVSLTTGQPVGAEALARWDDPILGSVPPTEFIPLAEETGLIVSLGEHVIRKSLRHMRAWVALGTRNEFRLAINLSARQLRSVGFYRFVVDEASAWGIQPGQIDLELTESAMMLDPKLSKSILTSLRKEGFGVSVDDFGTGYSSLSHLRGLPLTQIKLDRSFVDGMLQRKEDLAIVSAARAIASDLGVSLIAEGVESEDQLFRLKEIGYTLAQGYYFDPPLSAESFTSNWLSER